MSGVAVAATGLAVASGVVSSGSLANDGAAVALSAGRAHDRLTPQELASRQRTEASRSAGDRMAAAEQLKSSNLADATGKAVTHTEDLSQADPRTLAQALMPQYGFSTAEFSCLDDLWNSESGWNLHADNPTSDAYGIPQALPGSKMASAGPDWANNAATQIKWGLGYIRSSYGTPCAAWSFKQGHGWY
ncbi:MAG TPA: lytic transglycosylase domain-containing protein [Marmoricola sp.]|nr:lytic transglycosylase domain-containing protein [Marmoricola sp.]